jgi:predicted thioredoxin/glutaredoxin
MRIISVDEIVKKLQGGLLDSPDELSKYLVILSASLNTAGNLVLEAEILYASKWKEIKLADEKRTDKMTDMLVKETKEYKQWQKLRVALKTVEQCIMSLKKRLANMNTEYQSGQNF